MICPVCDHFSSELFKFINCESFDNSNLYKDVRIHKCRKCGHLFNVLDGKEIQNLRKYYKEEHKKNTVSHATQDILYLGINDVYSIPAADNSFDVVILDQVLEHLTDLKLVMKEIKRVLTKSGLCFISVPDIEGYKDENYWYIMREHVQHFSIDCLKLLAQLNGFELISWEKEFNRMIGTLWLPNMTVELKLTGQIYCFGIGREFMHLYPNTRLKDLDIILVDDTPEKQKKTFKGMEIYSSDILKKADRNSILIITAKVHKEKLENKVRELGYKGEIIDV